MWTDAVSTKGLGGYYIRRRESVSGQGRSKGNSLTADYIQPEPRAAFTIDLPLHIARQGEHINTKELRAVEQALLLWGKECRGCQVVMNINNGAAVYALENRTIRGAFMNVLPRCLLVAAECDLEMVVIWIPTKEDPLADALSRFNYVKITNIAPQLKLPVSNLHNHGFQKFNSRASQARQPTICGGD